MTTDDICPVALNKAMKLITQEAYDKFSTTKYDFVSVAQKCRYTATELVRIYEHLFHKKHILSYGFKKFEPYYPIAKAWDNLMTGNFLGYEYDLFDHENHEAWHEAEYSSDYETAHRAANEAGFVSGLNPTEDLIYNEKKFVSEVSRIPLKIIRLLNYVH